MARDSESKMDSSGIDWEKYLADFEASAARGALLPELIPFAGVLHSSLADVEQHRAMHQLQQHHSSAIAEALAGGR